MNTFYAIRLKLWLPLLVFGVFAVMLAANSLWQFDQQKTQLESQTRNTLKFHMGNLQHRIESLHRLHQKGLIDEEIAQFGAQAEVIHLTLLDEEGRILHSTHRAWMNRIIADVLPGFDPARFGEVQRDRLLSLYVDAKPARLIAYQPVALGYVTGQIRPTRIGALLLEYDLATANHSLQQTLIIETLGAILIGGLCMGLLAWVLHHWVSRPLGYLIQTAHRLSQGDFSTAIEFSGKGELAQLGNAFNQMQSELNAQISLMKSYQQELMEKHERLAVTLDSIGDAVITTDRIGVVTGMSPVARELTGWTLADAVGKPLTTVFHIISSQTREMAANPVDRVIETGLIVGLANHTALIARDGREYQIADSAAPIRNKAGQIIGVILVFYDVTEQYRQQALIAEHEAELRKITDVLPGPVSRVDRDGRYVFVSAAYKDWFGKDPADVIGLTQLEAIGPELYAYFAIYFERARKGERSSFEVTLPNTVGGTRNAIVNVIPDFDSSGAVCGYYTIGIDITERKQSELALREKDHILTESQHLAHIGSWTIELPGRHLSWADELYSITGVTPGLFDLTLESFLAITHPDDVTALRVWIMDALAGKYQPEIVSRIIRPGGELRYLRSKCELQYDHSSQPVRLLGASQDVTERKLAELEARQLREQLIQSAKMDAIGHLTAGIAHDFNNLLGAMMGYTELSQHVVASGSQQGVERYLDEIHKAGNRAKELILQMLTFSRLGPEGEEAIPAAIVLTPIVKEVTALLRSSLPATIDMNYQIESEALKACIQPVKLHQIILNLGINARDAMGEYGRVDIILGEVVLDHHICSSCKLVHSGDYAMIAVRDSGSGIPDEILDKIFDPFFTTKGVGKGTGMGLSVVHGLVHAVGGHIQVDSDITGCSIAILLPLYQTGQPVELLQAENFEHEAAVITGRRIMVVDDERAMIAMLSEYLTIQGALVSAFNAPWDALGAFEQHPENFDLIITDETMPGLSGMHLSEHLRKIRPDIPIILCTGYSEHANPEVAEAAGLSAFFYKPLKMDDLLLKIQEILAIKK